MTSVLAGWSCRSPARAYLLEILELVERDPGIEAASDDLCAVAKELAGGADRGTRMSRLLQEAFLRFGDRLATARPSEQARKSSIVPRVSRVIRPSRRTRKRSFATRFRRWRGVHKRRP